ncbi:MAG: beta strand repeat-containing protein [Flavisolibacter sp.]
MKKVCLFLFVALIAQGPIVAQVTVHASSGTLTGAYTTLKAAFGAINSGTHQGDITIDLNGTITESSTAELDANGTGSDNYSSIVIEPSAAAIVTGNFSAPLIDLNGAQHVVFDGRIGATGSARTLVLQNTSTSSAVGTCALRFRNDANNDTIRYANLQSSGYSTIYVAGSSGIAGNRQIQIESNDMGPAGLSLPLNAIYSQGSSSSVPNNAIRVLSNLVHDYFSLSGQSIGIFCFTGNSNWTITGNSIYQTSTRTTTNNCQHYGIAISEGNGYVISNNFIGGNGPNASGGPTIINGPFNNGYTGIYINAGSLSPSTLDGNTVSNLSLINQASVATTAFYGMRVDAGMVNLGEFSPNVIGAVAGTGSININTAGAGNTFCIAIYTKTSAVDIRNNIIGSLTITGTSPCTLRLIEGDDNSAVNMLNNQVGGSDPGSIQTTNPNADINGILLRCSINGLAPQVLGNTIRNLASNSIAPNNGVIYGIYDFISVGGIATTATISNNSITHLNSAGMGATIGFVGGIVMQSTGTSTSDALVSNNVISGLNSSSTGTKAEVLGIDVEIPAANFLTISNNLIHGLTTSANYTAVIDGAAQGIDIVKQSPTGIFTILGNTVYDVEATGTAAGILSVGIGLQTDNGQVNISRNRIYDLRSTQTTGQVTGLLVGGMGGAGNFMLANNMISLLPSSVVVYGIRNNQQASGLQLYYNSVFTGGAATGNERSASFYREGLTTGTMLHARNNIFYNVRTGGTGSHYALMNDNATPATGWPDTASAYNDLYTVNPAAAILWGSSEFSLTDFQSAGNGEQHSVSRAASFIDPSSADLHLTGASTGDQNLGGIPVSAVTDDFDGNPRNSVRSYMGADEILSAPLPVRMEYFTGKKIGTVHVLNWKISCTDKVDFEVQHSVNGKDFESIGFITAMPFRCTEPFDYTDEHPKYGRNYYRLKIIEANEHPVYSDIVVIYQGNKGLVYMMMPTLIDHGLSRLYLDAPGATNFNLVISNAEGKIIRKKEIQLATGSTELSLDLSGLPSGAYQLGIYSAKGLKGTLRFVVQ